MTPRTDIMKPKLIKTDKDNYILVDSTKGVYDKGYLIGSSIECDVNKLSKQNCDEIFGVVDVEKLALDEVKKLVEGKWFPPSEEIYLEMMADDAKLIAHGFNKAMELNKDKVFTLEQMSVAYNTNRSGTLFEQLINSFGGQPTEIEVEIVTTTRMENGKSGIDTPTIKPKLDADGRLILKKI